LFEDFKEKIRQHTSKSIETEEQSSLSPEVLEKLKERGINPETVTLQQLFPEVLDACGSDTSLMSGAETEILVSYAKTRRYLLEHYPQTRQDAEQLGRVWTELPDEPVQINMALAKDDPKKRLFFQLMLKLEEIYEKIAVLQAQASEYEKICLRFYWHLTYNWDKATGKGSFQKILNDAEIFEVVEAYFKICRKYHVPLFDEPYYFLSDQQRRAVKLEGDSLRRTTEYSDFEVHVSILEDLR
jgi:hypothetical protein